ncbi:MAG: hybrid sensor histidine kinase/response regulator [Cyanosarcina radialis HA8281-LM2]|jgi:chemotaxis family two-component system sensor histidine kinase/response regulator PixL|nr:hybrid sensor histidine kinase/response regulator [Cyanosarcina radialis HA8281-LM2]
MKIDTDIRDQAYIFFVQEAPELLQVIESELLTLSTERSAAKVHNMMRAAHSIKGGAASVGLETLKTIAHSLEDVFKALFSEEVVIDNDLESLLLQAYDCLRLPLMEQMSYGKIDAEKAMAAAEPVFAQLAGRLGDLIGGSANLPGSVELGVDIAASIFEVDVAQGIERLETVLANPEDNLVTGELRAQAEVFLGIGELLNLPGFSQIAKTVEEAIDAHPDRAIEITHLAIADFQMARQEVLNGDRTHGGAPSPVLMELANSSSVYQGEPDGFTQTESLSWDLSPAAEIDAGNLSIDDIFGMAGDEFPSPEEAQPWELTLSQDDADFDLIPPTDEITVIELKNNNEIAAPAPSLDDIFNDVEISAPLSAAGQSFISQITPSPAPNIGPEVLRIDQPENISEVVKSVEQSFEQLSPIEQDVAIVRAIDTSLDVTPTPSSLTTGRQKPVTQDVKFEPVTANAEAAAQLFVRVDMQRLERMNNLVGELAINRNSLSLQNEQLQGTVRELLRRFAKFQQMTAQLRDLSDQMLVSPDRYRTGRGVNGNPQIRPGASLQPSLNTSASLLAGFDSLEMDSYGELYSLLQSSIEEMIQLEEVVGDVALIAGQSGETLEGQRRMVANLRDDLMWSRMLPVGEVMNRFPRILRDLSLSYQKPVDLKLTGSGVLVDKAALEKLYSPLLHLVRNAFDHGIEYPDDRRAQKKPERATIEIRAFHRGSQTVIEVRDDGRGIDPDKIRAKAVKIGWLTPEQAAVTPSNQAIELLFQPGFSTADQISELSGRGVGLDVVRSELRSLKGSVTVASEVGEGTIFTLRIPLTLTIAKLLVCMSGTAPYALPSDSIEEIVIPKPQQIKRSGQQRFLHYQQQIVPVHPLSGLLRYSCPLPESVLSPVLTTVPAPEEWEPPLLLIRQDTQLIAVEVDRLISEQELVIKPFGASIAPPSYIYGCSILGDGSLVPVIDANNLLETLLDRGKPQAIAPATELKLPSGVEAAKPAAVAQSSLILIVDDSLTLRQTLALTLQKAGYRILQARDGREALEQLQQNSNINLVVSDVEMPNMNGFEFLSQRRQDPTISKIPVVMLTSRSSDKHQKLAAHLGAKAYFTKPYIEQEFLGAIKKIIEETA